MEYRKIYAAYNAQYQRLDEAEARGEDTAYLRIRLMSNHICDLEEQSCQLRRQHAEAAQQYRDAEDMLEKKYEELRCLAGKIVELEDKVAFLDRQLSDCAKEKEVIACELKVMTDRAKAAEQQIEALQRTVSTHEDTHDKFIEQIDKLMADNHDLFKEIVQQKKSLIELCQEKEQLVKEKEGLELKIKELGHEIDMYKHDAKEQDRQMKYKNEEVQCLLGSLDEAQARVLMWQTRALKADQATLELTSLRGRVEGLLPELQKVCASNSDLQAMTSRLRAALRDAQYEAECLREKVYTVSCECQELDTKYVILLRQVDTLNSEIADLKKQIARLKSK